MLKISTTEILKMWEIEHSKKLENKHVLPLKISRPECTRGECNLSRCLRTTLWEKAVLVIKAETDPICHILILLQSCTEICQLKINWDISNITGKKARINKIWTSKEKVKLLRLKHLKEMWQCPKQMNLLRKRSTMC